MFGFDYPYAYADTKRPKLQKSVLTQRDLTALVLRGMSLLALFYAAQLLEDGGNAATGHLRRYYVVASLPEAIAQNGRAGFWIALGPCAFCCGLAFVLWRGAAPLRTWFWRSSPSDKVAVRGIDGADAFTILLAVSGIYALAVGTSLSFTWMGSCLTRSGSANGLGLLDLEMLGVQLLNVAIHIGVGGFLITKVRYRPPSGTKQVSDVLAPD